MNDATRHILNCYQRLKEESHSSTVNLLLTIFCPFTCEHCMYECGPDNSRRYMPLQTVAEIEQRVREANDIGIFPDINLIGGEPTANLNKFEEIFDYVIRSPILSNRTVQISTNGWWLKSFKKTKRFLDMVIPHKSNLAIRISQDKWHEEYWEEKHLWNAKSIFSEGFIYNEDEYDPNNDDDENYIYVDINETNEDGMSWIYADNYSDPNGITPVGRGYNVGQFDGKCKSYKKRDGFNRCDDWSFLPNGKTMDFCCKGSWFPYGSTKDPLLVTNALVQKFFDEQDGAVSCWDCRERADAWIPKARVWRKRLLEAYNAAIDNGLLLKDEEN